MTAVYTGPRPELPVHGRRARFVVGRIWCVGRNYDAHVREMRSTDPQGANSRDSPDAPFFFLKPTTALLPGGGRVPYPARTCLLHHEVELVVALAGSGRDLDPDQALDRVYGYAVGLDLTRRDLQAEAKRRGHPWSLAKGFDRSAPCSEIVPVDAVGHPVAGRITATVNGVLRQDADISEMIWSIPDLIAELSREIQVRTGDLIFTGTPAGVGSLEIGDRLEAAIEGVGSLSVRIGDSGAD